MKIFVPDYYKRFKCIADKCSDSCCVGWAIEVDEETAKKYKSLEGEVGAELMSTVNDGEVMSFRCDLEGRCANLDERGLCQIITRLGEDYLCQICRDHPRYFNCCHGRCEGGLGLACEVAADLILSLDSLPEVVEDESDDCVYLGAEENLFAFSARDYLLAYLFDDRIDIQRRIGRLLQLAFLADDLLFDILCGALDASVNAAPLLSDIPEVPFDLAEFVSENLPIFQDLEVLTADFSFRMESALEKATKNTAEFIEFLTENEQPFRNLTYYFIHRYLISDDLYLAYNMTLAISCALAVMALAFPEKDNGREALITVAKDFSKNIEYSTENIEMLLERIENI